MTSKLFRGFLLASLLLAAGVAEAKPAKNVILFLGDAGGLPTLNAAGIYANNKAQSLFLHTMPYIGLSDTSSLDNWVTDSAAGMTAIMTGYKTRNGMNSTVPVEGKDALEPQTILEMAEQRGLSTGVITNMPIWDATPAVCYAHTASRSERADILKQLFTPRYGNGPEIIVGKDRQTMAQVYAPDTQDAVFGKLGYRNLKDPSELNAQMTRAIAITDSDFDPQKTVEAAIGSLKRNPKGYFLMVEWDMHTNDIVKGLTHAAEMDAMIRQVSKIAGKDTLILFTADHSYDLRLRTATRDRPLAEQIPARDAPPPANGRVTLAADPNGSHAGEEVLIAAMGPGAEQVRGFMPNTALFDIMRRAYGWIAPAPARPR